MLPKHISIVMDGNGRWAKERHLPRLAGHEAGVVSAREIIQLCVEKNIQVLSLFAFSSENWYRPKEEVYFLMNLLFRILTKEVKVLHDNNVSIEFIGDQSQLNDQLQQSIQQAQRLTSKNSGLKLVIAINYGGRWDIIQAMRKIAYQIQAGKIKIEAINQKMLQQFLSLADLPEPDLFIRTSGEQRVSNFFLWQLAYSELYFPKIYWPDFRCKALEKALQHYATRQRRFGLTAEQVENV